MDQPSRDLPRIRSNHRYRAHAVWTLVGVSLVLSIVGWSLSGLEEDVVLTTRSPRIEAFLFSHLYYHHLLHLAPALAALVVVGGMLESRWGTPRFAIFYFFTVWGGSLVTIFCGSFHGESYRSSGAASAVLGLLVAAGLQFPEYRPSFYLPPAKHLVWILIFLSGAALAYFARPGEDLLLPQVSGVPLALLLLWLDPLYLRWQAMRRAKRFEEERKKVFHIRRRVDHLLEKISSDGYESLTRDEQLFLRQASKHYRIE